jgi:dihydroorotate dehydrogenase (NAD+) catalytic subunit
VNISVQLAPKNKKGLLLPNPVMTASGTCGYGIEEDYPYDIQRLGAFICKGTTLKARNGNNQPRIVETAGGVLNTIGLQNIGVNALIKEMAPIWAKWHIPVIVNIAGETIDDYVKLAAKLNGVEGINALEVNISCPNIKAGGVEFGAKTESAALITAAVRKETLLPLIVKLTPNTDNITGVALAVATAGADAVSLINTLKGMAIDINKRQPLLGGNTGGLSGPAIKPVALAMVYDVAAVVDIPIIGCGGIICASDAIEFIMAGASAVQVGTSGLVNPGAPLVVADGIVQFLTKAGIEDIKELIGIAQL